MPGPYDNEVIDCDQQPRRQALAVHAETLRGKQRVSIVRYRPRRSDRQNKFYWPHLVEPFAAWLRENWGDETITPAVAHEFLKARFLIIERVDRRTGELFTRIGSTRELTTAEFARYVDRVADFLAQYCGIVDTGPRHD